LHRDLLACLTLAVAEILPEMMVREVKPREIKPEVDRDSVLAGAQFADAFQITVADANLNARGAAERMFSRSPRWVEMLLGLRNMIAAPAGLKTSGEGEPNTGGVIGLFPVLSETPDRLIAGFDDHHLDFRVVVDVAPEDGNRKVTTTTLVLTHNRLGRLYLAAILPFHRLIAKSLLRQVAFASAPQ
jgi:uncharacterized protein DUF2867